MNCYRDENRPQAAHRVRVDGVLLVFDDDGLLRKPTPEQRHVMHGTPLRQQRFHPADLPPPPSSAPAEQTAAEADSPRSPRRRPREGEDS